MEEVLFGTERVRNRDETADLLRTVAQRLEDGRQIPRSGGGESVTLDPPARPTFEVGAERETGGGAPERGVESEIEWDGDDWK